MSEDENFSNNEDCSPKTHADNASEEMSSDSNIDLRSKLSNKRRHDQRGSVKHRLGRRPSPSDYPTDNQDLLQDRIIEDLCKSVTDNSEEIAHDMAKKLVETKEELICK